MKTITFNIPNSKLNDFIEKITKINKKAVRNNCPEIKYTVGELYVEDRVFDIDGKRIHRNIAFNDITASYETIKVVGEYTFVGVVEKTPLEDRNIVVIIDEGVNDEFYFKAPLNCDHCNTNRRRKKVALLRKNNTEEIKMIGLQCVTEYIGINPEQVFESMSILESLINLKDHVGVYLDEEVEKRDYLNIKEITHMSVAIIAGNDWTHTTSYDISDRIFARISGDLSVKIETRNPNVQNYTDMIMSELNNYVEKMDNNETLTPFENTLAIYTKLGAIKDKKINYLTGYISRWVANKINNKGEMIEHVPSEFFGEVGIKSDFELTVTRLKVFEGDYGDTFIVSGVQTGTNNKFSCFTSKIPDFLEIKKIADFNHEDLKSFKITATVKDHKNDMKYGKQTIITRMKITTEKKAKKTKNT